MEKITAASAGTLSLNPQSRSIAKKSSFHCNLSPMHLESENDPVHCADHEAAYNACKNASAVRVVQIFNPVLVKTDVANFRLLVQKLTGKSGCSKNVWNKLRRLNYGATMEDLQQLHELNDGRLAAAGAGGHDVEQCIPDGGGDDHDVEGSYYTRSEQCLGVGGSTFSELDIYAGLVSDGPLPDITMLPPLLIHHTQNRSELSLCT